MSLLVNKKTIGTLSALLKDLTTETVTHTLYPTTGSSAVRPIRPYTPTTPTV